MSRSFPDLQEAHGEGCGFMGAGGMRAPLLTIAASCPRGVHSAAGAGRGLH